MRRKILRSDFLFLQLGALAAYFSNSFQGKLYPAGSSVEASVESSPESSIKKNIPEKTSKNKIIKKISSTQESICPVGLGTWKVFDVVSAGEKDNLKKVLQTFTSHGGQMIDSSPMYGRSEQVVGELLSQLNLHSKFFMATKVWTNGQSAGKSQIQSSFEKLQRKTVDLFQVHNLVDVHTHLKTLRELKAQGKIRYVGITHYHLGAYEQLIQLLNKEPLDFIQFNYNLLDREAERRLLPLAQDKGVAVIINRPFQEGALFSKVRGMKLPQWCHEFDIHSWAQYFLKFIISHPAVTCAIGATSKIAHMQDNMQAAYGRLPNLKQRQKMVELF